MNQNPVTYTRDYLRDLRERRRDPAPQVTVHTAREVIAIPVAVLPLPGPEVDEFLHSHPQDNPVAQHASPFELTLALACEEQGMKRARQLAGFHMYNPYPHSRQTTPQDLAQLLSRIDAQCGGNQGILTNIGNRLSRARGALVPAELAAQVVERFQELIQEQ